MGLFMDFLFGSCTPHVLLHLPCRESPGGRASAPVHASDVAAAAEPVPCRCVCKGIVYPLYVLVSWVLCAKIWAVALKGTCVPMFCAI